ncbi:MAG: two-component regulator propeller domain-containing protein, partial [Bacteroidota bacterium]
DSRGRIWLSGYQNISYIENKQLKDAPFKDQIKNILKKSWVHAFSEDSLGNVWFSVDNRHTKNRRKTPNRSVRALTAYKIGADSVESYVLDEDPAVIKWGFNSQIKELKKDHFIYTGLSNFNDSKLEPCTLEHRSYQNYEDMWPLVGIKQLSNGRYLGISIFEVMSFDQDSIYFFGQNLFGHNLTQVLENSEGDVYFGTQSGLWVAAEADFSQLKKITDIPDYHITGIVEDKDKNIWLSTYGVGLLKLAANTVEKISWAQEPMKNSIVDLKVHQEKLYISNEEGAIFRMNADLSIEQTPVLEYKFPILMASTGKKLFTTNRWLLDGDRWEAIIHKAEGYPTGYFRNILATKDGHIWVGTRSSFYEVDLEERKTLYDQSKTDFEYVVNSSAEDSAGNVWFTSGDELYKLEEGKVRDAREIFPQLDSIEIKSFFLDLLISPENHICLSTLDQIIILIEDDYQILRSPKELTGTKNFELNYIDSNKSLWVAAFGGIDRFVFNSATKKYERKTSLSSKNALPIQSSGELVEFQDKLYLGTNEGLYIMDPEVETSQELFSPLTYIEALETSDSLYNLGSPIVLPPGQEN